MVLKWSRARKRYEHQGLLVEEAALQQAEQECLADAKARAHRREREAERRAELDQELLAQGWDRSLARDEVCDKVDQILERWQRE